MNAATRNLADAITEYALAHRTHERIRPEHRPDCDIGTPGGSNRGSRNVETAARFMDAARLDDGGVRDRDSAGNGVGKDRLDNGSGGSSKALWREMMASLCNGTRVFAICLGLAAFIVVM